MNKKHLYFLILNRWKKSEGSPPSLFYFLFFLMLYASMVSLCFQLQFSSKPKVHISGRIHQWSAKFGCLLKYPALKGTRLFLNLLPWCHFFNPSSCCKVSQFTSRSVVWPALRLFRLVARSSRLLVKQTLPPRPDHTFHPAGEIPQSCAAFSKFLKGYHGWIDSRWC